MLICCKYSSIRAFPAYNSRQQWCLREGQFFLFLSDQVLRPFRFWLIKLYEALNPSYHGLRPTSNMITNVVTAFPKAIHVVLEWTRAMSLNLKPQEKHMFLTFAMQAPDFALIFDTKGDGLPFSASLLPSHYDRWPSIYIALQDLLKNLSWNGASSVATGISIIRYTLHYRQQRLLTNL